MPFDPATLRLFPERPGVYLMKDLQGEVLYIGKAINLKRRIKQYFAQSTDARLMLPHLVAKIERIEVIVVSSEKEAFLLENNLIKQHQPRYNALLKDDKSYIALKISRTEKWPAVKIVRYRGDPKPDGWYFGPYTSAKAARQTLDLLHSLFPLRRCSDQELARRIRPCLLYQMKRCAGPCVHKCTEEAYRHQVNRAIKFLGGQDREVLQELYKEMEAQSAALAFEQAHQTLKTIQHIEHTLEAQHVDRPLGLEADVMGIYRQGTEVLLVQLVFKAGRLTGSRHFDFSGTVQNDQELLSSFLLQYYDGGRTAPPHILIPMALPGQASLAHILSARQPKKTILQVPSRGAKKALLDMAQVNAEALFHAQKKEENLLEKTLLELQECLGLARYPYRIECLDHAHWSGSESVAALAVFVEGQKQARLSRTYALSLAGPGDDYAALREVLGRRYKKAKAQEDLPDLLIIDGGKGHLQTALKVFEELNIVGVEVMALAKDQGNHGKGMTQERIFLPGRAAPLLLDTHAPVLWFLQKVRDEAHRMAIFLHRQRRSRRLSLE